MGDRVVPSVPGHDRGRWWALATLCAGSSLVELALLTAFDPSARPELAPQANALAPFGVFSDLRWLSVYNSSWPALAAEALGLLVVRAALTALSIGLAWPSSLARPRPARLFWQAGLGTLVAAVLLVPSVVVLFGAAVVPVSWLFLAGVPAALLVAVIVHPVGIASDWWRRAIPLRGVGWVFLSFVVLSLSGSALDLLPRAAWPLVCALSGLFNAWAWAGAVHAVVGRRAARIPVPLVPLAVVALASTVVAGTMLGFDRATRARDDQAPAAAATAEPGAPPTGTGMAVLLVAGYGSSWDGRPAHPVPGPFYEERFSYRGLGPGGRPLGYAAADTVKSLPALDSLFLRQVRSLAQRTGHRVAVVGESEGAMVAKTALLAYPGAPVSKLVLASPLLAPGRVIYPTRDDQGWGLASGQALGVLDQALEGVSPIDLSPDSAFLASLDSEAPLLSPVMSCPLPQVRQFALLPLADATVAPGTAVPGTVTRFPTYVIAAFHGGLVEDPAGAKVVGQVLEGRRLPPNGLLQTAERTVADVSGAWQVPSLAPSAFSAAGRRAGPLSCDQLGRALRSRVETWSARQQEGPLR